LKAAVHRRRLTAAAVRLARLLGPEECVLIGGLAVAAHGFVRATDDIDFITRKPLDETRKKLRETGIETRLLRGDILDGGFSCVKGEIDGIAFDVLPPLVPIPWDEALPVAIGGGMLRVVPLDSLLQLKFRAGGPQDLLDVARLVLLHPGLEPRARELATAYRALDRFEIWLRDPRIRAQAREEAKFERRRIASKPRSARKRRR
jgi:hypothetical protein